MGPYLLLMLDRDLEVADPAALATALADLGYQPQAQGAKGPVDLAPGCWIAPLADPGELGPAELRRRCADQVSTALERLGARGGYLLHLCLRGGWAYRPVPRSAKGLGATAATRAAT